MPTATERTPFALVSDGSGGSERAVRNAVMGGETLCAACLTETATGTVHMRLPLASRPVVVGVCHACGDGDIGREWHVLDHVQDGTLNIGGL